MVSQRKNNKRNAAAAAVAGNGCGSSQEQRSSQRRRTGTVTISGDTSNSTVNSQVLPEGFGIINPSIPRSFYCPLSWDIMFDPVLDSQGDTYERSAIEAWLQLHQVSPHSKAPMGLRSLIQNRAMKDVIHNAMGPDWVAKKTRELPSCSAQFFLSNTRRQSINQHRCVYRKQVDSYLEDISNAVDLDLELGDDGTCAFQYMSLEFRVNVVEQSPYYSITCESLADQEVVTNEIKDRILRLNHFQTHGACVSLENTDAGGETVTVVYIKSIDEVTSEKFRLILEDFLGTAVWLKAFLLDEEAAADFRQNSARGITESDTSGEDDKRKSLPRLLGGGGNNMSSFRSENSSSGDDDKQKASPAGGGAGGNSSSPNSDASEERQIRKNNSPLPPTDGETVRLPEKTVNPPEAIPATMVNGKPPRTMVLVAPRKVVTRVMMANENRKSTTTRTRRIEAIPVTTANGRPLHRIMQEEVHHGTVMPAATMVASNNIKRALMQKP